MESAAPLYLHAPLTLEAPTGAAEGVATRFSGLAYSGAVLSEWGEQFVVDLASTTAHASAPLLHEHQRERIIGSIGDALNDGTSLHVAGELFADIDPVAREIATKAGRGVRYQMSIGLFGARTESVPPDHVVAVNGRELSGPLLVLRGGEVREVSIVTLGADANTNAAFFTAGRARHPSPQEDHSMSEASDLQARLDALQAQVSDLTAARDAATERAIAAEQALAELRLSARRDAVRALFADLGREATDAATATYLALSDEAFAAVAADLRAAKPKAPAHLFTEHATGEPADATGPVLNLSAIYAARRGEVK